LRRVPKENLSQYQSVENKQGKDVNSDVKQGTNQQKSKKQGEGISNVPDIQKGNKKAKGKFLHH
jgi:hypothetical protein